MQTRDELLASVARVARWNGGSICVVAGLGALLSSGWGTVFGLAVFAGGLGEVLAGRHAPESPAAARRGLVASQLWLMALIGGYALWRLATLDANTMMAELGEAAALLGAPVDDPALADLLLRSFRLVYVVLLALTAVYQGGMAWFYRRRLGQALASDAAA